MNKSPRVKIALVGKPNSGKSSLFNQLTGLKQKIGNFPGITVDKRTGSCWLNEDTEAEIIDLPGIYSLYPRTLDEKIVVEILTDRRNTDYPDAIAVIADATNLKNCLLLLTQLVDLRLPVVLALNMMDLAAKSGLSLDVQKLSQELDVPVIMINAREGKGIDALKRSLAQTPRISSKQVFEISNLGEGAVKEVQANFGLQTPYEAFQYLQQADKLSFLSPSERASIKDVANRHDFFPYKFQGVETINRYAFIQQVLDRVVIKSPRLNWRSTTRQLDRVFTHRVWGYAIFFLILFLIFQSVFAQAINGSNGAYKYFTRRKGSNQSDANLPIETQRPDHGLHPLADRSCV